LGTCTTKVPSVPGLQMVTHSNSAPALPLAVKALPLAVTALP
jgi:hypothetical protein